MGRVAEHLRKQSVAYLALLMALILGTGAAYAAGEITSRDIKNDTIRAADLDLPLGAGEIELEKPVSLTGGFQSVLSLTVSPDDGGGIGLVQAVVELHNTSQKAAEVRVRLVHSGAPGQTRTYSVFLPAGTTTTAPATIAIDGLSAGKHTFALKASAPDGVAVSVQQATLVAGWCPDWNGRF